MRKKKFYFGRVKLGRFGTRVDGKGWGIPRILRRHFFNEYQKYMSVLDADPVIQVIKQHLPERDPNPPVVPAVRYCDYELAQSPEAQAAYDATVQTTKQ